MEIIIFSGDVVFCLMVIYLVFMMVDFIEVVVVDFVCFEFVSW